MSTINFKATDKQVMQMAALATNASMPPPGSPGWEQYDPAITYEADDFKKIIDNHWMNLDYINGRSVKFTVWRGKKRNEWKYPEHEPTERQTWISTYPSYPELMKAAGIELV